MTIRADSSEVSHQPADASKWTKPHEEVDGKLDELGDRMTTQEATGGGDFMADGSVPMTGTLDAGGNDIDSVADLNATGEIEADVMRGLETISAGQQLDVHGGDAKTGTESNGGNLYLRAGAKDGAGSDGILALLKADGSSVIDVQADGTLRMHLIDAKGDLLAGTADNTPGKLTVGTNGFKLVADSGEATGLKWIEHYVKRLTANYPINNDNTATVDPTLQFTATSGKHYHIRGIAMFSSTANADLKIGWQFPSGYTSGIFSCHGGRENSVADHKHHSLTTTTTRADAFSGTYTALYDFDVYIDAGTGGVTGLYWAQNVSHADNTTLDKDSFMVVEEVP